MNRAVKWACGILTVFWVASRAVLWMNEVDAKLTVHQRALIELKTATSAVQIRLEALEHELYELKAKKFPTMKVRASWYGEEFHGRKTASGEIFNKRGYTAASMFFPMGAIVALEFKGRRTVVRITDRGPAAWTGRSIDVSEKVAELLGMKEMGEATLTVRRIS